ncbi:MAG: class I SAM-dependent methyltransferase [Acidimicrobiales bacterium]|nr:class I SAM-dependent methyltransferase [Acidimicrobiales bacterium]
MELRLDSSDEMFVAGRAGHYLSVGLSAMRCLDASLENSDSIQGPAPSILDLPCGHGRVLRFMRARYPSANITVSDIDPTAMRFCQKTFKCQGVVSIPDFDNLELPGPFDLVWCGSLFTHLAEEDSKGLLRLLFRNLSSKGTCVITTHGQLTVDRITSGHDTYGLTQSAQKDTLSQVEETGYGYAGYEAGGDYGISIVTHPRMLELVAETGTWHEAAFIDHGWDGHQDVYALRHN